MCGINGIYGLDRISNAAERVQNMNEALIHRGPDASEIFTSGQIALGHARLAIIDLNAASNQPMTDNSGRFTLVFNGEIYNFKKIKSWLSDYHFKTESDTEVVLAAYIKWGEDCMHRFNGMFSIAIWDDLKKELFIARDRLGIKPLYYHLSNESLTFSSELRALIKAKTFDPKLSVYGLHDYLRYQTVHAPATILQDVKMLLPGHFMIINDSDVKIAPYWKLNSKIDSGVQHMAPQEVKEQIKAKLSDAVDKRLMADVPYGAFLSGGIDSSIIVGLMAQSATQKVKTFSVVFDEEEFSEAKYARMIAKKFDTEHHEIKLSPDHFLKTIPDALAAMDHPSGDGPNTYVVSQAVKQQGVTMALSGLGGDELFAGYDVFKRSLKLQGNSWALSFPPGIRRMMGGLLKLKNKGVSGDKMAQLINSDYWDIAHTYPISRQVLNDDHIRQILSNDNLSENNVLKIGIEGIGYGSEGFEMPNLSKVTYCEMSTYMQNVLLRDTDQMSMAHALEVRVPFLDHDLVEFVLTIKDSLKFPKTPKQLLVESMDGMLPSELVNRPKMGFTFPWEAWLNNELKDFAQSKIEGLANRSLFNRQQILNLWSGFLKGDQRITWSRIWYLIVLEDWLTRMNINE